MRARSAALGLLLLVAAPAHAQTNCPTVDLRYDEAENIAEKRTDKNHDCKADEVVFYANGKPERAEADTDLDGKVDVWTFFEKDGKTLGRQEQDSNKDGKVDRWIQFRNGK